MRRTVVLALLVAVLSSCAAPGSDSRTGTGIALTGSNSTSVQAGRRPCQTERCRAPRCRSVWKRKPCRVNDRKRPPKHKVTRHDGSGTARTI